jgi:hypothetical protein
MGEKERAEALLQAAGVTGVAVQTAEEQVTVSRVELEALRAGAAPAAPAETPGQEYARQQQAAAQAAAAPGPPAPAGKAPLRNLDEWEALPQTERLARMDEADFFILRGDN